MEKLGSRKACYTSNDIVDPAVLSSTNKVIHKKKKINYLELENSFIPLALPFFNGLTTHDITTHGTPRVFNLHISALCFRHVYVCPRIRFVVVSLLLSYIPPSSQEKEKKRKTKPEKKKKKQIIIHPSDNELSIASIVMLAWSSTSMPFAD